MFIGEAPGKLEAREGRPFVPWAPAGKELELRLETIGLRREQVYLTNLIKEHNPGDKDPTPEQIRQWEGVLLNELEEVAPEVVVTLGRYSTRYFLGDVNMDAVHGIPHWYENSLWLQKKITVMPVLHPAAGLHNTEVQGRVFYDFQQLERLLNGGLPYRTEDLIETDYRQLNPIQWTQLRPRAIPAVDTEGSVERPWGLSISDHPGTGIVLRSLTGGHFDKAILHSALHDLGVLEAMQITLDSFDDTMLMAYLLGVEPQGLKALAYRHCGMEMQDYSDVIRPTQQNVSQAYFHLLRISKWPKPAPVLEHKKDGTPHVKYPQNLKQRSKRAFTDLGKNPDLDLLKRWRTWPEEICAPAVARFGDLPEADLDWVPEEQAIQYAARDADATGRLFPILYKRIQAMGLERVYRIDLAAIPMFARMMAVGMYVDPEHFRAFGARLGRDMADLTHRAHVLAGYRVNLGSGDQVADLLFNRIGLRGYKWTKGRTRYSVADDVLESLKGEHPIVPLIQDYREREKLKGTYADKLSQWVGADGRIHPKLRITRVPSGRPSCSEPNLLAQPTRTELGREIRKGFLAPEGRLLGTWDLDQIEMRILAHESRDENLMGVFRRGEDIHTATAAKVYGKGLGSVSKDERSRAKNVGFGVIYAITAKGVLDQMRARGQLHWTLEDCQKLIDEWFRVYPGVRDYQEERKAEARRLGYVRDMCGRLRYLPGVRSRNVRVREDALRQAVNHGIQSGAQEVIKTAMAKIWKVMPDLQKLGYVEPWLQIHDELLFEFDEGLEKVVDALVRPVMETAFPLRVPVGCSGSWGRRWSDLK